MNFLKKNISNTPFVGVFCALSNKAILLPPHVSKKDELEFEEKLGVRPVKSTLANCSLVGVLGLLFEEKIVVPGITTMEEKKSLEKQGLEVMEAGQTEAFGNLATLNEFHGFASPLLSRQTVSAMEKFFKVGFSRQKIAGMDISGACLEANSNGFIVNPGVSAKEFEEIEKKLQVKGVATTANYGDRFVGNSVLANNRGAIIGSITTTHEITRIDEAFRR
ncbi:MAG: translation initiation factor IF-6 [Candidatus Diapherotrites archaeon]|nr:translation initiation factor IF-6 [Candidatus Diapherotrites archaeon]